MHEIYHDEGSVTYPGSECELQIIRTECIVINCCIQCRVEEFRVAEKVFGNT